MKLPPMNALKAIEAASRKLSVSRAAEELGSALGVFDFDLLESMQMYAWQS